MHVDQYAAMDHAQVVDLKELEVTTQWEALLAGLGRYAARGWWLAFELPGTLARRTCGARAAPRYIDDGNGGRPLSPDSESETEGEDQPCQAARVGIQFADGARPLQHEDCRDRGLAEPTVLLAEDAAISEVDPPRPGEVVRLCLCAHHAQKYCSTFGGRKCCIPTCFRIARGSPRGAPLCVEHACQGALDAWDAGAGARPGRLGGLWRWVRGQRAGTPPGEGWGPAAQGPAG